MWYDNITAERFGIAAGARPASLGIAGDSTRFLELDELPPRLVFVGGGYISFEFAGVAARAGSRASVLHQGERPSPGFDPDLVDQVVDSVRDVALTSSRGDGVIVSGASSP